MIKLTHNQAVAQNFPHACRNDSKFTCTKRRQNFGSNLQWIRLPPTDRERGRTKTEFECKRERLTQGQCVSQRSCGRILVAAFGPSGVPIFLHFGLSGLHIGIGPPSKADITGAATVKDAPTKPTTTIIHFTARFMGVLSPGRFRWGREPHGGHSMASYQSNVKENFFEIMPIQENMYYSTYFHRFTNVYISQKKGWKRQDSVTKIGKRRHSELHL